MVTFCIKFAITENNVHGDTEQVYSKEESDMRVNAQYLSINSISYNHEVLKL